MNGKTFYSREAAEIGNLLADRLGNFPGLPSACRIYEFAEDGLRGLIDFICALGMPLHSQNKVIWRGSFQSFNDSVFRTLGHDTQAIAGKICGLMVA
jgi:hypothetical protein